jgi:hypothetical protein
VSTAPPSLGTVTPAPSALHADVAATKNRATLAVILGALWPVVTLAYQTWLDAHKPTPTQPAVAVAPATAPAPVATTPSEPVISTAKPAAATLLADVNKMVDARIAEWEAKQPTARIYFTPAPEQQPKTEAAKAKGPDVPPSGGRP